MEFLIALGLPFLAVVFFMEGALIGKMLPTDFLLPAAVILYATQSQFYLTILVITVTSSTAGQYWLFNRFKGKNLEDLHHSQVIRISDENMDKIFRSFEKRGLKAVTISNFIPFIRGLLTIPAAVEGFDSRKFVIASALGTLVLHSFLVAVGAGLVTLF